MTTPAGVSGAVVLLPVQVSVLHVPNPSLTPTNLLFNVIATPGAIWRYRRAGRRAGPLTRWLLLGTLPGVIAGSIARVEWVSGPRGFLVAVALVIGPLGAWLLAGRTSARGAGDSPRPGPRVAALALVAGTVGGIYGIGGGSIIGPVLAVLGYPLAAVAPAALTSTFVTSVAGVISFQLLQTTADGSIAPQWDLGVAMGAAGLLGGVLGAHLQPRLPERALRRLLGALCVAIAIRYLTQA